METAVETEASHHLFLVLVDNSEEMRAALRYACRRAHSSGGVVALLRVIEPMDFPNWTGVGRVMEEEVREKAEALLQTLSAEVYRVSGKMPVLFVREGVSRDALLALMDEEPSISTLVLAAGTGSDGPGPMVSALLMGKLLGRLHLPLTIIPGSLSDEQIDRLT